jgi:glyoxylase-like metal-dependent hydrolase (beta-lactamase superfamily II)
MEKLKIHPVPLFIIADRYAKPKMTYLQYFGEDVHVYCYTWYIEGAEKKVLVDTGGTAETVVARGRPKDSVTHVQTLEEGLAKYNLKPDDIDIVIITHLHWDHIELAYKYKNATFIVQEEELNTASDPDLAGEGYIQDLFKGVNFATLKGDTPIMNGIKVLFTPGHSTGGQSVAIETEKGTAVIPGFCCIGENFEPDEEIKKKTPFIIPGIHLSVSKARESMVKVIEAADIIIPLHEPKYADVLTIP